MTLLFRLVLAHLLVDLVAHWAQSLLLTGVTHLPGHRLAVLVVHILLGLLWSRSDLKFAPLHGLSVAVLFLLWHWEFVGELFTEPRVLGLADLFPHLSWSIITLLGGYFLTLDSSLTILVLMLATFKVDAEDAGPVLDNLLFVPTILVLQINTLEVIPGSHSKIIHSITDSVSNSGTSLHGVGLVHHLVLDVLHELAHQFSHVEALSVLRLLDDRGTVLFVDILAVLCLVSVAGLLLVGQTLILVNSALYRVAVILVFNLINFIRRIVVLVNRWLIGAPVTKNKVWLIWYKTSIHQGNHTKKKEDHYCNSVAGEDTIMIQNFNQNVYSSNY